MNGVGFGWDGAVSACRGCSGPSGDRAFFKVRCSLGFLFFAFSLGLEGLFAQLVCAGLLLSAMGTCFCCSGRTGPF